MATYASIARDALAAPARCALAFVRACLVGALLALRADAADLPGTIAKVKPSVVGIGTFQKTRSPSTVLNGTGFAVRDGRHVVTNAHVLREINAAQKEELVVLLSGSNEPEARAAVVVAVDRGRDIAVLRIEGAPLPALAIADSTRAQEGMSLAFTGFPIGMALGLYPATHRATLAALVPIARAGVTARELNPRMVARLRDSAYVVFQLDATAYPGNSGSPLYHPASGEVFGIVNSVFIQGTREQVISRPSGITYAIPSIHIRDVLEQAQVPGAP